MYLFVHTAFFSLEYSELYGMLVDQMLVCFSDNFMAQNDCRKVLFPLTSTIHNDYTWTQIIFIDLQHCSFV